jgi:glycosyltransferase A (GT-A) superfamily protein (DUF2064 family)
MLTPAVTRKPDTPKRTTSLLTETGDAAKAKAERALLLKTLRENDWNLTATAEALRLGDSSAVIRALKALAFDEYEAARKRGAVSPANRRPKPSAE